MHYQKPKGTMDILPSEVANWQYLEQIARTLFSRYDFHEIRTPLFEHIEVITRGVGESTDIVSKEMYDFFDKGKRHVTLRPEGTAPVVRSYVENKLFGPEHQHPFKTYYIGPMFRYERPQSGRLRQFHQIGIEVLGSKTAHSDVEAIAMALDYFQILGITQTTLVINSLGSYESRQLYRQALIDYLQPYEKELSADSKRRLQQNPLRVLDSKEPQDQEIVKNAPSILAYLDAESQLFFTEVQELLSALEIEFTIDPFMVRGLDYYNETIFEIMSGASGFNGKRVSLCAGGRYDGLIQDFGGPVEFDNSFGFAIGVERVLIALEAENNQSHVLQKPDIYIASTSLGSNALALELAYIVRQDTLIVKCDYSPRSLAAHLRLANKLGAGVVMILNESDPTSVKMKNMKNGIEKVLSVADIQNDFLSIYYDIINL